MAPRQILFQVRKRRQAPKCPHPDRSEARALPRQVALLSLGALEAVDSSREGVRDKGTQHRPGLAQEPLPTEGPEEGSVDKSTDSRAPTGEGTHRGASCASVSFSLGGSAPTPASREERCTRRAEPRL